MAIGRLDKRKRSGGRLRTRPSVTVARKSLRVFSLAIQEISGVAVYDYVASKLRVTVSGASSPTNFAPGVFLKEVHEWPSQKNCDGSSRRLLSAILERTRSRIAAGAYPEPSSHYSSCSRFNEPPLCSSCSCYYCTDKG